MGKSMTSGAWLQTIIVIPSLGSLLLPSFSYSFNLAQRLEGHSSKIQVRPNYSPAPDPPMAPHLTQNRTQSPTNGQAALEELPPPAGIPLTSCLTALTLPHSKNTASFCSLQTPGILPPQGLRPCCSLCLQCSYWTVTWITPLPPSRLVSNVSFSLKSSQGLPKISTFSSPLLCTY